MLIEFFLKVGTIDAEPPYLIQWQVNTAKLETSIASATKFLAAADGRLKSGSFADDTERSVYMLGDCVAKSTYKAPKVAKILKDVLIFLATDTPERLAAILSGRYSRIGFVTASADVFSGKAAISDEAIYGGVSNSPVLPGGKRMQAHRLLIPA